MMHRNVNDFAEDVSTHEPNRSGMLLAKFTCAINCTCTVHEWKSRQERAEQLERVVPYQPTRRAKRLVVKLTRRSGLSRLRVDKDCEYNV